MKSKIVLFFTIIACFLLQSTLIHTIAIGSITPNLLLILCVSMGLMRGRKSGMWTGFFCGVLTDLFFGSVLGFYAMVYMFAGFLSGYTIFNKQGKCRLYVTSLISTLSIQRQIETIFRQEGQTGRIRIDTVNINGSTTC